jgi:hypothetical protein
MKLRDEVLTLSMQARERREYMQRHRIKRVMMQWRHIGLKRRFMRRNLEYYEMKRMGRWQTEWFRIARREVVTGKIVRRCLEERKLQRKSQVLNALQINVEIKEQNERNLFLFKHHKRARTLRSIIYDWMHGVDQANQEEINSYIQERYFRRIIMSFNRRTV